MSDEVAAGESPFPDQALQRLERGDFLVGCEPVQQRGDDTIRPGRPVADQLPHLGHGPAGSRVSLMVCDPASETTGRVGVKTPGDEGSRAGGPFYVDHDGP
jgi:hypothetical protein